MTKPQDSREQRHICQLPGSANCPHCKREADIARLNKMLPPTDPAHQAASEQFYSMMQADLERAEFERAAAEHRIVCKRGRLWWFGYRIADWVLRRFGA